VTSERFAATGYMGPSLVPFRPSKVEIPVSKAGSIRYRKGKLNYNTSGDPKGLYLDGVCVLPDLTEQQAGKVVDAIAQRFPEIGARMRGAQ
jgi:hypothetical protein